MKKQLTQREKINALAKELGFRVVELRQDYAIVPVNEQSPTFASLSAVYAQLLQLQQAQQS